MCIPVRISGFTNLLFKSWYFFSTRISRFLSVSRSRNQAPTLRADPAALSADKDQDQYHQQEPEIDVPVDCSGGGGDDGGSGSSSNCESVENSPPASSVSLSSSCPSAELELLERRVSSAEREIAHLLLLSPAERLRVSNYLNEGGGFQ